MIKKLLTLIFVLFICNLYGQEEHAWVYFKDKPNQITYLSTPSMMLSQRALDRRTRYNIPLDAKDVPIESSYLDAVSKRSGFEIMAKSKWLNAIHVIGNDQDIRALESLSFVEKVEFADRSKNSPKPSGNKLKSTPKKDKLSFETSFDYGVASNQIEMLNGHILHDNDFTGQGMHIALLDGGFSNVDNFPAFDRLHANNQILGGYDFVNRSSNFYTSHYHGMAVLSTIAGYVEGEFIGTAPDAKFYLFITEDVTKETPLEESLWVEAAEKVDSLGVDVVNTSLGYTTFDDPRYNYTYDDLDGNTTFISRGASIAFSRGMILVNSAGNEGNDPWYYINAPSDAKSVLSIGAVDNNRNIAQFSSFGPAPDGTVKPDVSAQGAGVYVVNPQGQIGRSNGTSFSSPVLAGVISCLWQALPEMNNEEIIQLVREAGHLFYSPTAQEGYGIPDFEIIYDELIAKNLVFDELLIYPNPTSDYLQVGLTKEIAEVELTILNLLGKTIHQQVVERSSAPISISHFSTGIYLVKMSYGDQSKIVKLIKK